VWALYFSSWPVLYLSFYLSVVRKVGYYNQTYSGAQKKVYEYCFMKQNCQIQMGVAQYKNVAMLLGFWGISTTHQHFQMRYVTLI